MSADICVVLQKTKKGIVLSEAGASNSYGTKIGTYKTADKALAVLEDIMEVEGNFYEGIILNGFNDKMEKRDYKKKK